MELQATRELQITSEALSDILNSSKIQKIKKILQQLLLLSNNQLL